MKRREFIMVLGCATAWPLAAHGQPQQMRRVGALMASAEGEPDTKAPLARFRQGLERLGWVEGRNIRIDYRFAAGIDPDPNPRKSRTHPLPLSDLRTVTSEFGLSRLLEVLRGVSSTVESGETIVIKLPPVF